MKRLSIFLFLGVLLPTHAQQPPESLPKAVPVPLDPAALGPSQLPVVFYQDFRGKPLPNEVTLAASKADAVCAVEPEGLRITISKKSTHPKGGVGIKANIGLKGDFEATATVEILNAETPKSGAGVGASIYAATQTKTGDASLTRLVDTNGRQVLVNWSRGQGKQEPSPGKETTLRLRLKRTGNMMFFLWSPGLTGDEFQVSGKTKIDPKDVEFIRLTAGNDQKPFDIDVRWLDLQIRGEKNTEPIDRAKSWSNTPAPGTTAVAGKNPAGKSSLAVIVLVIGLVITIIAVVACWLYVRKRS